MAASRATRHGADPGCRTVTLCRASTVVCQHADSAFVSTTTNRCGRSESASGSQQRLEARRIVERPDQGEAKPAAEDVGRDPLHVLDGDGVEAGHDLLGLDGAAFEELAAEA